MNKTLRLALNKYAPIPTKLRDDPRINSVAKEISVNLASLYHHYYLDSFDIVPPNPDPAQFEHVQFLLPIPEFRFQGDGLGISPSIRRHRSNELGQAFCRWFLYENLEVTYFAHIEKLLGRQLVRPFRGCQLDRIASGDTPDYLCATSANNICLAEAKGRYASIGFDNREFSKWREQFSRIELKDSTGIARQVKGHIVATRYATESNSDRLKSTIFAEDPESPGQGELDPDSTNKFAQIVRSAHYSNIAQKLRQPILASSLANGVSIPEELQVVAVAWRVRAGPLQGRRFVGGYFGVNGLGANIRQVNGHFTLDHWDPCRLDQPSFTFFGVEENIFRQVVKLARYQDVQTVPIETFQFTDFFYSGFSVLRDGTTLAPLDFFIPEEQVIL